jgi:hypothetical protein
VESDKWKVESGKWKVNGNASLRSAELKCFAALSRTKMLRCAQFGFKIFAIDLSALICGSKKGESDNREERLF